MGDNLPAVDLGTGLTPVTITKPGVVTCALLSNSLVKCWGDYPLVTGIGDDLPHGEYPGTMGDSLPFVNLGTGRTVLALAGSDGFQCALLDDGKVKCWGFNGGFSGLGDFGIHGEFPSDMGDNLPFLDLGH
jgi:hypothetical protein